MEVKKRDLLSIQQLPETSKNGERVDIQWRESIESDLEIGSTDHLCKGRHCETTFEKL